MKPTEEQQSIINSQLKRIRVIAFAGAAKSTTLRLYAEARPDSRILLVCFNKANQVEAEKSFPPNVTAMTSHALAMRAVGVRYKHKLVADLRINDVATLFNTQYQVANGIISTLKRFLVSAGKELNASHIDPEVCKNKAHHSFILQKALSLWQMMQDVQSNVGMLHDGYLKLYQLSEPKLDNQYNIILYEEAQDSNPVTTSIIKGQVNCGLVVVGDPHQSIYSFRGADNSLDKFDIADTFYLTKSFRFGNGVAKVANALLQHFKRETKQVVGAGKFPETLFEVDVNQYHAVISRTNAALFDEAVKAVTTGRIPHFVGGVKGYRMSDILDAYYLYAGDSFKIRGYLKAHRSWASFDLFVDESNDPEGLILRKIVLAYTNRIPGLIDEIMRKSVDDPQKAHVTLATAHKSKGLEFDQVVLTDDFPDFLKGGALNPELTAEDINLMYVAVTRAERAIRLNSSLHSFMDYVGEQLPRKQPAPPVDSSQPISPAAGQSLWLVDAIAATSKRDVNEAISDAKALLSHLESLT